MPAIRFALPSDWPRWHALDGRISRELFLRKTAVGECYVAESGGAVAGLLRWNRFWDEVPFCTLVCIEEARRGEGLGRALVERWEADMRALGHGMVMTSTQSDEEGQHFWRALGYLDAGSFDVDVPGYEQPPELILTKEIPHNARGPLAGEFQPLAAFKNLDYPPGNLRFLPFAID